MKFNDARKVSSSVWVCVEVKLVRTQKKAKMEAKYAS